MGGFRDAVKIIDKTPEELEQIRADVKKPVYLKIP